MAHEEPYYTNLDDRQTREEFVLDFADWLRSRDRNDEAKEFMQRVATYTSMTPQQFFNHERLVSIARDYAPVRDLAEEMAKANRHQEALDILAQFIPDDKGDDDTDDDRDVPVLSTLPVDMDRPECEDVEVYLYYGDNMLDLAARTVLTLIEEDYPTIAAQFAQDALAVVHRTNEGKEMLRLIWSYVVVVPEDEKSDWNEDVA